MTSFLEPFSTHERQHSSLCFRAFVALSLQLIIHGKLPGDRDDMEPSIYYSTQYIIGAQQIPFGWVNVQIKFYCIPFMLAKQLIGSD